MGILGTAAGSRNKDRKKKPDELLASVVRETAIPAAVELLRANTKFVFPSGTAWVMLVLNADAIGGLSKRHGRDQSKGSLIELISSDQIQTLATAQMLSEEAFGIIPTEDTLARMSEYSLLTGAAYSWAVVWQKPSGELIVDLVSDAGFKKDDDSIDTATGFAQAKSVAAGTTSLQEIVSKRAWAEHSGLSDDEVNAASDAETEAIPRVDDGDTIFDVQDGADGAESADDDEDQPVFDAGAPVDADEEIPFDESPVPFEEDTAVESEVSEAPIQEYDGDEDDVDYAGNGEVADTDESPYEQEAIQAAPLADQDQAREVIARRFLNGDLDLDVGLNEFNASFAIGAPVVQIAVPESATEWLGDQIAQLNRQANADLSQLRWGHEDELRTLYVNLMSQHAEQVIREVAIDGESSPYRGLQNAADAEHEERLGQKEEKARTRKTEIIQDFEAQAKKHAEQAAIQAELQFKERSRSKMEREQIDAIAQLDRDIENDHTYKKQGILRLRRQHAALKMQTGQTRIFNVLAERQSEYLDAEQVRLDEWKVEIQRIVDDNRKADIAQSNTLAEHYRVTDELGTQRREQETLLASIRTEHEDRIRRMESELERNRKDAVVAMQARDEEWKHSLEIEQGKTGSQAARVSDLLLQVETAEDSVGRRYEARVAELENDKTSYANELARASEIQSRYNKMIVGFMVGLPLLGGLAGFITGVAM